MTETRAGGQSEKSPRRLRSQKLKDEFLSLAAHEIRTPITVIKAQAQLAERFHAQGKLQGEVLERALKIFVQESDRLARLCTDLLDVARLDTGCFEVNPSVIDIGKLISDIVIRTRHQYPNITLEGPEKAMVFADRDRILQVIHILLNNAIRFNGSEGAIKIQISSLGPETSVAVRDFGLGIASEKLPRIFDRYYQAHQSGLKGPCGLGIGLYLSREIIRRMKGRIEAKSEGLGKGAEFVFTLPSVSQGNIL